MNTYCQLKASQKERMFFRKYGKRGRAVYTVKSKQVNIIEKVTDQYVFIRSKRDTVHRLPRVKIRQALSIFFYRRVITLKELIKIHSYSSVLAALIQDIMMDISKVIITKTGAVRLTLRGLRYIFSGLSRGKDDIRIVKENGGQFILLNYVTIRNDLSEKWKTNLRDLGFDYRCIILDPGEKTLYDAVGRGAPLKPIDINDYADFVIRHSDVIYQYLTLDRIGDPATTQRNTYYLAQKVGRRPIPIYHIQSPLEELQKIVDEDYEVIAIGGSALKSISPRKRSESFDAIFRRFGNKANFHALGLGSMKLLLKYDWFSADASSWLNGRIFRQLITMSGYERAPDGMSSEEALGFNIRNLVSLEERDKDLQMNLDMVPGIRIN